MEHYIHLLQLGLDPVLIIVGLIKWNPTRNKHTTSKLQYLPKAGLYAILPLNYSAEPLAQLSISNTAYYL